MSATALSESSPLPYRRTLCLILLVAGTFFMEMLDGTVIVTALPAMARGFGATVIDLNMAITAYLLTLGVFIPVSGWIADRYGSRSVFAGAIGIFTFASLLCAMAPTLPALVAARVLQGIGGAMMVPVGRLVVLRVTPKAELMSAMTTIVWPGLIAPVLGPPLGGLIVTHASWPWIFLLNLPFGLVAMLLALRWTPNQRTEDPRPLDRAGALLTGAACVAIAYGLDLLGDVDASPALGAAFVAAGVSIGVAAIRHLRRAPVPLLDLSVMRYRSYAYGVLGGSLFRAAIATAPYLLPLMFQVGMGMSAERSGFLVLAVFAGNLAMKSMVTPVLRWFGFRNVLVCNGALTAITLALCAAISLSTPLPALLGLLFVSGLSRSMQFSAIATIAFADIPQPEISAANTLNITVLQLTLGLGVAVGALLLHASSWLHGTAGATPALADFRTAFIAAGALAALAAVDAARLPRDAGAAVSGHRA